MKAKLKKHVTEDGLFSVFEEIPLGKEYDVDPTRPPRVASFYNTAKRVYHKKEIIWVFDEGVSAYFPAELLEMVES